VAGNGANWTDTKILKSNGLTVLTSVHFDLLIRVLRADRFAYISRGWHDIHNDIHNDIHLYSQYDLAINSQILLRYKYPVSL